MSELVEKVVATFAPMRSWPGADDAEIARAAIATVFDWLATPSKAALEVGISMAGECLDHDWDSGTDGESYNSYTTLRSDAPATIFKAMLAHLRKEALDDRP